MDAALKLLPDSPPGQMARRLHWWLDGRAGAIVLLYHRVADDPVDPWRLAVGPVRFAEHLDVLRRYALVLPLADLVRAAKERRLSRRTVAITFDDGYADNLTQAKPLLERFDLPATVFVTTGATGRAREFWWDEVAHLLVHAQPLPKVLDLRIEGRRRSWRIPQVGERDGARARSVVVERRAVIYRALSRLLQRLPAREIDDVVDELAAWAAVARAVRNSHRAMSDAEIASLADGGLVSVGAHTVTHPWLPMLAPAEQYEEVRQNRTHCEAILGRPVMSFAYPYGAYSDVTVAAVREARLGLACSARAGVVHEDANLYSLPRFFVDDSDGEVFAKRLRTAFIWRPLRRSAARSVDGGKP